MLRSFFTPTGGVGGFRGFPLSPPNQNPALLPNLEINLDGRFGWTTAGAAPNLTVTRWADQSGNNRDMLIDPPGAAGPPFFHGAPNGDNPGLAPGVDTMGCISGGGAPAVRGKLNSSLPSPFTNVRGFTQYILVKQLGPMDPTNGQIVTKWPDAGGGASLIYQGAAFSFFGGVLNGHVAIQVGGSAFDTGVATPVGTWDLWTIVNDTALNMVIYRGGSQVASFAGVTAVYDTELDMFGPSIGADEFNQVGGYLFYTAAHSALTVALVHAWYQLVIGAP